MTKAEKVSISPEEREKKIRELASLARFVAEKHGNPFRLEMPEQHYYMGHTEQKTISGDRFVDGDLTIETRSERNVAFISGIISLYVKDNTPRSTYDRFVEITKRGDILFEAKLEHNGFPTDDPELIYNPGDWEERLLQLVVTPRNISTKKAKQKPA